MLVTGEILQNVSLKVLEAETSRIEIAVHPSAEGKREEDRDSVSLECPTEPVTMAAILPSQFWMVNSPKHTLPQQTCHPLYWQLQTLPQLSYTHQHCNLLIGSLDTALSPLPHPQRL